MISFVTLPMGESAPLPLEGSHHVANTDSNRVSFISKPGKFSESVLVSFPTTLDIKERTRKGCTVLLAKRAVRLAD